MSAVGGKYQPGAVRRPVGFAFDSGIEGEARGNAARGVQHPNIVVSGNERLGPGEKVKKSETGVETCPRAEITGYYE